jgi:hypothetical protein
LLRGCIRFTFDPLGTHGTVAENLLETGSRRFFPFAYFGQLARKALNLFCALLESGLETAAALPLDLERRLELRRRRDDLRVRLLVRHVRRTASHSDGDV